MGWLVKDHDVASFVSGYLRPGMLVLDAGSGDSSLGESAGTGIAVLGLDIIRAAATDVLADLHQLPVATGSADAVICNAVLQYCRHPDQVLAEFHRVLRPGGLLYLDVPWVQPYCPGGLDRWRFSEGHLVELLEHFDVVEHGPSIRPGSALAMQAVYAARWATRWRAVNVALAALTRLVTTPLRWLRTHDPARTAGAVYAVARRPGSVTVSG